MSATARSEVRFNGFNYSGDLCKKSHEPASWLREVFMGVLLRVTAGPHLGEEYCVELRDTFTVGRSSRVHFPMVYDQALSREHFQINNDPPLCHLVDLGSTNGTKVNGLRVGRVLLREGTRSRPVIASLWCNSLKIPPRPSTSPPAPAVAGGYRSTHHHRGSRSRFCLSPTRRMSGYATNARRAGSSFPGRTPTT